MSNPKNNPILVFNLCRRLTPRESNLLVLVLPLKVEPSGLKNHNNLNKVDTNNILSFINYITTDKQAKGLLLIEIKI